MMPLLESNALMGIHPPVLYLGFIACAVPFAVAMGSLLARDPDGRWQRACRDQALFAWCCLTAGLLLGALWSYEVLGWGGYWAWDPVENAALLPWLTLTAYLHAMRRARPGGAARAGMLYLSATFVLVTIGTFLTRGSLLTSVHAFAESPVSGMYLGFIVVTLGVSGWVVGTRAPRAALAARPVRSPRNTALLANNLILGVLAVTVLTGTLYPLVAEVTTGVRVSVGRSYYEEIAGPLLFALVLIAGVGQLPPWGDGSARQVAARVWPAAAAGVAGVAGAVVLGVTVPAVAATAGAAAFTIAASVRALGARRVGASLAHAGLAVTAVGVAMTAGLTERGEATLSPGGTATFAGQAVTYSGVREVGHPGRTDLVATLTVGGDRLAPALRMFQRQADPVGVPAIRHGITGDLYVTVISVERPGDRATFQFHRNPGIGFLWGGGAIAVAGGLLVLAGRRGRREAMDADVPRRSPDPVAEPVGGGR